MPGKILWISEKSHLVKFGNSQSLADYFHDFCILMTNEKGKDGYSADMVIDCRIDRVFGGCIERECTEETGSALLKLKNEINEAIKSEFNIGKEYGRNLLMQLNNNEITPEQFIK